MRGREQELLATNEALQKRVQAALSPPCATFAVPLTALGQVNAHETALAERDGVVSAGSKKMDELRVRSRDAEDTVTRLRAEVAVLQEKLETAQSRGADVTTQVIDLTATVSVVAWCPFCGTSHTYARRHVWGSAAAANTTPAGLSPHTGG